MNGMTILHLDMLYLEAKNQIEVSKHLMISNNLKPSNKKEIAKPICYKTSEISRKTTSGTLMLMIEKHQLQEVEKITHHR
nr:hypothetical protein [Wolbachia endosymbiont of Glossina morsitans morsitans]